MSEHQPSETSFPDCQHFALTWSIPESYAGMTSALLRRSRSFVQEYGAATDVLTFDSDTDYAVTRKVVADRGDVIQGVRIRNMWEELRQFSNHQLGRKLFERVEAPFFSPLAPGEGVVAGKLKRTRSNDAGAIVQADHFRDDGTLLVSDRRDVSDKSWPSQRVVTLCDRQGRPVHTWDSPRPLYFFWLDSVVRKDPSVMIVDSKTVGNFLHEYKRHNVVTLYLLHNTHFKKGGSSSVDVISALRGPALRAMDHYDGVIALTASQKGDLGYLLGDGGNLHVVGNATEGPRLASTDRVANSGVMLARLTPNKRVEHGIKAVAALRSRHPRATTLDIFGHGEIEAEIASLIDGLGPDSGIQLRGYQPNAKDAFATADYSLLTSRFEGFGLVLVESMAAGCIPIAYDIRYGPADIITHGVDGYLVEPGNIDELAATIREFLSLTETRKAEMREAARKRVLDFSDQRIAARWSEVMFTAIEQKRPPEPLELTASPAILEFAADDTVRVRVRVTFDRPTVGTPIFHLVLRGRETGAFIRHTARSVRVAGAPNSFDVRADVPPAKYQWVARDVLDLSVDVRDSAGAARLRLHAPHDVGASDHYGESHGGALAYITNLGNISLRMH
ncbi:glycosyltransferase [Saxibacter everestensis]|uniref:Glycosyltransferase n=1 Tax=Saxibacter everestensis TaxID=2909229 RepID=A0ABY8QTK0_9MICO|nr:glycosyltransferase [Brevibacteriaceae bacterium ZFBP1038]